MKKKKDDVPIGKIMHLDRDGNEIGPVGQMVKAGEDISSKDNTKRLMEGRGVSKADSISSLSNLFQGNRKERRLQAKRLKRKMK